VVVSASEVVVAIYVHHMNDKVNSVDAKLDPFKWLIVSVIIVVGVYCNNYFAAESVLYRVFGLLMLAAAAGWLAAQTIKGKAFIQLGYEAKTEIRKVVWPTRQETTHTTLIVVVVVVILAVILWALDSSVSWIIAKLIGV
jgi:preprotein translocase subunit SecE